jgi:hypothetical protein
MAQGQLSFNVQIRGGWVAAQGSERAPGYDGSGQRPLTTGGTGLDRPGSNWPGPRCSTQRTQNTDRDQPVNV